ncbi:delta(24)-sterol reductase [Hyalella azteca]|uniref:Delta(24)-sterol reductase n=1 Tax=Hyalella azteca TaxID=294128 RepID=A0A979FPJ7_HYAAZ|nr:delta(24)-sterol reductase [Hyalella azteca]
MASLYSVLLRWLEKNRGIIVVLVVLPLSVVFSAYVRLRQAALRWLAAGPQLHDSRVIKIQAQVKRWAQRKPSERKLLCTARPNWQSLSTTFFRKDLCEQISLPLYNILNLDEKNLVLRVEPLVTVGQVTSYLVPRGYTLAVCLEVAEATLGGLAMGVGMTTYSHKVGLYQESVVSYDVVLGDGSLVTATATNDHSDLYYTLPWSHGTLGFLVALELKIIRIKPHLKLEYIPVRGQKQYCDLMRRVSGALDASAPTPDYVEATVFSKHSAVVMVGTFSDVPDHERHKVIPFCNNPFFRYLFGFLLPPKIAFLKFTTTPGVRAMTFTKQVFQDIVLPMNQLEDQINKSEELFDIYPLLVYPCRIYDHGPNRGQLRPPRQDQLVPGARYAMFNDLGVYGVPRPVMLKKPYDAVKHMRLMERFTRDCGGYAFLYADTFMTRQEFEEMFDLTAYERCRTKYCAEGAFPHLYDKTKPEIDVVEVGKRYIDPL